MREWTLPLALSVIVCAVPASGQADQGIWRDAAADRAASRAAGQPVYYRALQADVGLLQAQLDSAPREYTSTQGAQLSLPMPDGTMQRFEIVESPVMEPGLAQRYPEIHTYRAVGIDDPTASGRLDVTPQGFHAMIQGASGSVFIDPAGGGDSYRSYYKRDYGRALNRAATERPMCLVEGAHAGEHQHAPRAAMSLRTGDQLRNYRLAVAATGEYTTYHGGTVPSALAAIVTAINRVNQIYERDLAIHLNLIATNDQIIYTDAATDNYTNDNAGAIVAENQAKIDAVIGTGGYDIGHVFSTGSGGLAGLGVVCASNYKARGTTGLAIPTGDPFYIDYVAHEMGHQFGANHSFNGSTGSCVGGNRNGPTAYEPGSGSTVMAYAGICGDENLQSNSDATFHAGSIEEILAFVAGSGAVCASTSATGNTAPTANAGADYSVPCGTPFVLTGSATDPDAGDVLTYQWDQMDTGTATDSATFGTDLGDNALFRSFLPRSNSYRHFPRLINQLANKRDKAETLPTTSRILNFRLTVRDGNSGVGEDDMQVTVDRDVGPFRITSLSPAQTSYNTFDAVTVNWDAAGSEGSTINCAYVDIDLLTFNAGRTSYCTHSLASNTPNDGSQQISIPAQANTHARFRVMCRDNIFYDITDTDVTIISGTTASTNCINVDQSGGIGSYSVTTASCKVNSGGIPGGGGGGAFGLWLLALLGIAFRLSARRSA